MRRDPSIIKTRPLAMQLCVPEGYTEEQIIEFANRENPCGIQAGWFLAKDGDSCLGGAPARVNCGSLAGFVHVVVAA